MIRLLTLILLSLLPFNSAQAAGQEFRLFYSNDVHGETEPCG